MLNLQLMTERDRREAAAIERRRQQEEERKKRIFNPRTRLIGIDADTLKQQVDEKRRREEEQQRIDRIFEEQLKKSDQIAIALERKEREEKAKLQQEINNYRKNCQRPEDRREFDLNDPDLIKKQLPCRVDDNDPRLGPSSAQKFEGEDLQSEQRAKIQHEELKAWLEQQIHEREMAEKERKAAEDAYMAAMEARDHRALDLDTMEKECRKKLHEACLRYNKALAKEKECERQINQKKTREDDMAEIYNALTSDMLTENPEICQSSLGLERKIGFLYKGMNAEERRKVRDQQIAQIEEAKKRKELEKRMDKEMDNYLDGTQKTIYLMDRELEIKQRALNKQLAEENKLMASQMKDRKKYMEKVVYSNVPSEKYFDQFNKSTR